MEDKNLLMQNKLKKYFALTLGVLVMVAGFKTVLAPHSIIAGGVSGLSLVIYELFGLNKTLFVQGVNVILFILSLIFISKEYALKLVLGSLILFPLFLAVIPEFMITEDKFLAAVMGGMMSGIAVSLLYYANGSTGGTTTIGMFIHKIFKIKYSLSVALADATVIIVGFFVFGLENTLYAIIFIVTMVITADYLESGFKRIKVVHIVTPCKEEIIRAVKPISNKFIISSYDEVTNRYLLIALVPVTKLKKVLKEVDTIDGEAYIYTTTATSTFGDGLDVFKNAGK